jgi:hypothetical protein
MTYDALMFLTGLFRENPPADTPVDGEAETTVKDLPIDWWLLWDERAAIMEYDGGLSRERAETEALADTLRAMRREAEMERAANKSRNLVDTGEV